MAQSTVKLIVDAQNAIRPLQRVNQSTKLLSQNTEKLKNNLHGGKQSFNSFGASASAANTKVNTFGKTVKNLLATLAVFQTAKFVIFQTAQLETQTKALEVLTGSSEKAFDIVKEIKAFGAVTPFKSSELIEVTKRMAAFGFATEEVVDITKRIADIAGTAGADIDGVALAIGKVQAKNKFMQEENIMLLEKGINVTKELEEITGMNGETLAEAMSKGEIGANKFVQAIKKATSEGGQFFEGASKQSDTLAGKFSTFVDNVETFAQNLGTIFEEPLKFILDQLNAIASEFNKIFSLLTDANIGASNRAVGAASFKSRFGAQKDAVSDITKAVELLDPSFVKTEEDAAKLFAQLDRISDVMKVVQGPDSVKVLEGRGLLGPLIEATNQMDDIRKQVKATLAAQKQLTIENKKTNEKVIKTKDNTENIKNAVEGTVTLNDLFNGSLSDTSSVLGENNVKLKELFNTNKLLTSDADKLRDKYMEVGQAIEKDIVGSLTDALTGVESFGQAAANVLNSLKRKIIEVQVEKAVAGIGNAIGGFLGNIFGGGGGMQNNLTLYPDAFNTQFELSPLLGFADGGKPPVGKPSIVGERGPELFIPSISGTIIPNEKIEALISNSKPNELITNNTTDKLVTNNKINELITNNTTDKLITNNKINELITNKLITNNTKNESITNNTTNKLITNNTTNKKKEEPILGFAKGGRPPVGRPSIVGEKGPEIFVPSGTGTVIPNNKIGGQTNIINVSVDAGETSVAGDTAEADAFGKLIAAAIQSELIKQKRPGGLLN